MMLPKVGAYIAFKHSSANGVVQEWTGHVVSNRMANPKPLKVEVVITVDEVRTYRIAPEAVVELLSPEAAGQRLLVEQTAFITGATHDNTPIEDVQEMLRRLTGNMSVDSLTYMQDTVDVGEQPSSHFDYATGATAKPEPAPEAPAPKPRVAVIQGSGLRSLGQLLDLISQGKDPLTLKFGTPDMSAGESAPDDAGDGDGDDDGEGLKCDTCERRDNCMIRAFVTRRGL